jgi:hypothetical protein
VAVTLFVNDVEDVKVTFEILVVVFKCGVEPGFTVVLVELFDDLIGKTGTVPLTTMVEPETDVILPNALENALGRAVPPPGNDPRGNLETEPPVGRNPPKPPAPPAPPNPPPPVHDPVELGWVSDTTVAAKCVEDGFEVFEDAMLVAVTQSPTARSDDGKVTVCVKCVDAVQVTVTWPLVGFCTSIEIPGLTAAMVPEAEETDGLGTVVVVVLFLWVAASAGPPTLAKLVPRARPSPKAANLERVAVRTIFARGLLEPVPIKAGKFCSFILLGDCFALRPDVRGKAFRALESHHLTHSLRSASMGDNRAARVAGYTPKTRPMAMATTMATAVARGEMVTGLLCKCGRITVPRRPARTPPMPPNKPRDEASTRN